MVYRMFKEWFHRYAFAELVVIILAMAQANLYRHLFGNLILTAVLVTWVDSIVYYVIIAYKDLKLRMKRDHGATSIGVLKVMRNMLVEFGPAEYMDILFTRPFLLSVLPLYISPYSLAIFLGTISATTLYYLVTVSFYELRKRLFKD